DEMDVLLPGLNEIESAARLIYQTMPATPQYSWPLINARAGAEVWVKHENHTQVGAFKVRGGLVYMDWLRRERPEVRTVVSACRALETIYVPIGMGSGVCGTIAARNALGLATKVVGVVSSHAPAYALSFAAGEVREHEAATAIADGVACRKPDAVALEIIRR